MERRAIEIGQRFERLGRWPRVWQVEAIKQAGATPAHVMLCEASHAANKCTIAPTVLLDPDRFRPIGQADAKEGPTAIRRNRRPCSGSGNGKVLEHPAIAVARTPLAGSMMIEHRSAQGYMIKCQGLTHGHKFLAKHPEPRVMCPFCGNTANSMALLLDFIARERPLAPPHPAAGDEVAPFRPTVVADRPAERVPPLARILRRA